MLVNLDYVLKKAQEGNYAVGLFNTIDTDMLEGTLSAAEELKAPIIIGTAEVLLPYGELKLLAPSIIAAAERAEVPVVVHYDHGLTFERCMEALKLGFSSIMFDGSGGDAAKNISDTAQILKIAHAFGATVEGEIGHVGEAASEDNSSSDLYTTPDEAEEYISKTGIDALAVAIGTAHGNYKTAPKLDLERLRSIYKHVSTPLVLHGGSGLSDDDFRNTVKNGISKINIFTDICSAGTAAMRYGVKNNLPYLDIRSLRVEKIKETVKEKIKLFGSSGKA